MLGKILDCVVNDLKVLDCRKDCTIATGQIVQINNHPGILHYCITWLISSISIQLQK